MIFAENFKRICKHRGTTPTAIMKKWGMSTSKVSAWYKGSLPKEEMLVLLAKELKCTVKDFFADEEDIVSAAKPTNEDERDLLHIYRGLSGRDKHKFMVMAYKYENKSEEDI